nr:hypothetical protein [Halomicroarcula amylolytica]
MVSQSSRPPNLTLREVVRFYLLDHKTPVGKAIDIALLSLNLLFIAVFVVETIPTLQRPTRGYGVWRSSSLAYF